MGDLTDQQIARLEEAMTQRRGIRTLEDWIEGRYAESAALSESPFLGAWRRSA